MSRPSAPARLTETEARELAAYVAQLGERRALRELGLCDATVARAIARLPIQRPTAALLRIRLGAMHEPKPGTEAP